LLGAGAIGYFAYRAGFSNNNNNNLSGNATAAAGANTTSQQAHTETSSSEAAGYDQFGVKKIYPDASPAKYSPTTGGGNLSVHIRRPPQPPLSRRQWEIAGKSFLNQEVTIYFNINFDNPDSISIKLRGGPHNATDPMQSCCYIHYIPVNGYKKPNNGNLTMPTIGKQCPHLEYVTPYVRPLFALPNVAHRWVGAKAIEWNVGNGNGVHCETWIDLGDRTNQWRKWIDVTDTGQLGDVATNKPPFTKSPWQGNTPKILFRVDIEFGVDVAAKYISAREISPPYS
jgi:hypothetical protein